MCLTFTQENVKNKVKINDSVACMGSWNFFTSDTDTPQDLSHLPLEFTSSFSQMLLLLHYSNFDGDTED